ncbi:diacylglycerol/lipid kinase family protein [Teichococcus aestuarii]|uniref:diacylglycerol/lipid kinase family protein n=1 Tax=Teichococcus aestuarii TaxID=568898 RepID=UPI00361C97E4
MQALLFHNPSAGQGDHSLRELTAALERAGLSLRVCPSKGEAAASALETAPDLVIVAGGDGTVGRIATRMPSRAHLAILPFGTANNLARSLGLWDSHRAFAESWRQARRSGLTAPSWKAWASASASWRRWASVRSRALWTMPTRAARKASRPGVPPSAPSSPMPSRGASGPCWTASHGKGKACSPKP